MIIYKITNKINGLVYVGQTARKIKNRVSEHKYKESLIGKAIKDLGEENFTFEVIEKCKSKEELIKREKYWIEFFDSITPRGYNMAVGDSRYGENNGFFGKQHNENTIRANKLKQPTRQPVLCVETGEIFESLRECSEKTGMSKTQIARLCQGKVKKTKGFTFKYLWEMVTC